MRPKQLQPAMCNGCGRRFSTRMGLGQHWAWNRRGKKCVKPPPVVTPKDFKKLRAIRKELEAIGRRTRAILKELGL